MKISTTLKENGIKDQNDQVCRHDICTRYSDKYLEITSKSGEMTMEEETMFKNIKMFKCAR